TVSRALVLRLVGISKGPNYDLAISRHHFPPTTPRRNCHLQTPSPPPPHNPTSADCEKEPPPFFLPDVTISSNICHKNVTSGSRAAARVDRSSVRDPSPAAVAAVGGGLLGHPLLEAPLAEPPRSGRSALRTTDARNDQGPQLVCPAARWGAVCGQARLVPLAANAVGFGFWRNGIRASNAERVRGDRALRNHAMDWKIAL